MKNVVYNYTKYTDFRNRKMQTQLQLQCKPQNKFMKSNYCTIILTYLCWHFNMYICMHVSTSFCKLKYNENANFLSLHH